MKLLIDTNVILDIFLKREPFFEDSYKVIRTAAETQTPCFLSANAVTDIFYILRKNVKSPDQAREYLYKLTQLVLIADVLSDDITMALRSEITDFEDAVAASVAERIGADYIVTRNVRDFSPCKIKVIKPKEITIT